MTILTIIRYVSLVYIVKLHPFWSQFHNVKILTSHFRRFAMMMFDNEIFFRALPCEIRRILTRDRSQRNRNMHSLFYLAKHWSNRQRTSEVVEVAFFALMTIITTTDVSRISPILIVMLAYLQELLFSGSLSVSIPLSVCVCLSLCVCVASVCLSVCTSICVTVYTDGMYGFGPKNWECYRS